MIKTLKEINFLNNLENFLNKNNNIENKNIDLNIYKNYFSYLNFVNDGEIKINLSYLNIVMNEKNECNSLEDHLKCCNESEYHLSVKRVNGQLYFYAEQCEKIKKFKIENNYKKNFLYSYYEDSDISNIRLNAKTVGNKVFKSKAIIIDNFLKMLNENNFKSFYIYGSCGIGKTFLSSAFLNEIAIKYNKTICFIYVPEFVNLLKSGFSNSLDSKKANDIYQIMKTVDLLCLDDLGSEYATDWFYSSYLLTILNLRASEKKPIFFNSNFKLEDLEKRILVNLKSSDKKIIVKRIIDRIKLLINNNEFYLGGQNQRTRNK